MRCLLPRRRLVHPSGPNNMLADIGLDGLGIDDVSFPRAQKLDAYTRLLGSPSRTESPGAPAPAGHRNNQIHFFDNLGIYLNEHHATRLIQGVTFAVDCEHVVFPTEHPFAG